MVCLTLSLAELLFTQGSPGPFTVTPCACPSSTAPICAADTTVTLRTPAGGGTRPFTGCCFIPSASSCSYLAGTTGRSSHSRMICRGEVQSLTRLCHQNDVTVLQSNFLSSCETSRGVCQCEPAWLLLLVVVRGLDTNHVPLLACLPPQAALWSDDVQFPPLD